MDIEEYKLEEEKLNKTIQVIHEIIDSENNSLEELYGKFAGDRDDLFRYVKMKKLHIANLVNSLEKPYFARIDFTFDEDGKKRSFYIGKNDIMQDTNMVVTDWRAPISSLYYNSQIGNCSYEVPSGLITGSMSLKRQYEISSGKLDKFIDVDLVSNDDLLQKYLNENNTLRLKNIVSTIQKEQNDVIRKKLSDNIIVQGVAGSGKTTVALHRIAYLVYNYMKTVKQNQYLVIGPNKVFLKYIKSVLPDLDVSDVDQSTFEQYAQMYINEDISINSSDSKVVKSIAGKINNDIDKFKCSMKYKEMLDKFLKIYFYSITSEPLMLGGFEVLPQSIIQKVFRDVKESYPRDLDTAIEVTIDSLEFYIGEHYGSINSKFFDYSYELFKTAKSSNEKEDMRKMLAKSRSELEKNCRSTLRKYFSKTKVNSIKLYKLFISTIEDFDIYNYKNLAKLKKETMKNIKEKSYDFEDLAALIYIKSAIFINKNYTDIKHVVVDEAQDLGAFNFFVLKKTLPYATFSIFGDLAQSIYDYRSINNWDEVNDVMFNNAGEIINFNKSYRTTSEIMNMADDIAESIGLNRSDLVVRHGDPVQITEVENSNNIPEYISQRIMEFKEKGYNSIAVISKTSLLSSYINDDLKMLGIDIPNVSNNDDLSDERFRICTISNQLSKGLEFDAVIINNASEQIYSSDTDLDMKLLYVALTRALHELDIVYFGKITAPLGKHLQNSESLQFVKRK